MLAVGTKAALRIPDASIAGLMASRTAAADEQIDFHRLAFTPSALGPQPPPSAW